MAPDIDELIAHFHAIPWCRSLLQQPSQTIGPAISRVPKPLTGADSLLAETLNTPTTISHFLVLCPIPPPLSSAASLVPPGIKALVTFDTKINGFPGICHGGIIATVLDEVLGLVAPANRTRPVSLEGGEKSPAVVTAYLNTTFVRPVRTPGTVLVVASAVRVEGRKIFVAGAMRDGHGLDLARAEGLFVEAREKL